MKKIVVFFAALAIFSTAAVAQDTITMFDPYYMYRPIINDDTIDCDDKDNAYPWSGNISHFQIYEVTTPTRVYGVALTPDNSRLHGMGVNWDSVHPYVEITAILYAKEGPGHYVIIDSVNCGITPYRGYFLYQDMFANNHHCYTREFREFYFNRPCTVSDTCFLGIRATYLNEDTVSNMPLIHIITAPFVNTQGLRMLTFRNSYGVPEPAVDLCDEFSLKPPESLQSLGNCEYILSGSYGMWGGIFPIKGFHCKTPPQGLHYSSTGGGYYDLVWNSKDGGTYEVAVGLYGDNPDTVSRRYVTTDTTMRLDSLVPGTIYAVWVRGQCHYSTASYDTVIWSAWSGKIPVVATATGVQEAAGPSFDLSPNPASRTVNVSCEATEGTIEVVDMDGRLWLQVPATQRTLDISRMGWGYYVVRLTTPEGTAIRLLQVN